MYRYLTILIFKIAGNRPIMKVSWKEILKDRVTWALLCGQVGHDWVFFLLVTELPTYLKNVLKFNIEQNGILNSVPYPWAYGFAVFPPEYYVIGLSQKV